MYNSCQEEGVRKDKTIVDKKYQTISFGFFLNKLTLKIENYIKKLLVYVKRKSS